MNIRLRAAVGVTVIALGAGLASTACGQTRWCEHDDTDTKVANSFCETETPGYEWEPDGDDHKKKPKKTTSKKTVTIGKQAHR